MSLIDLGRRGLPTLIRPPLGGKLIYPLSRWADRPQWVANQLWGLVGLPEGGDGLLMHI